MGKKTMTEEEYEEFDIKCSELETSNDPNKDDLLDELYDSYERNLTYVGSSAIEDKLQDGVPDTIAKLIESKIRVWVLTGDK